MRPSRYSLPRKEERSGRVTPFPGKRSKLDRLGVLGSSGGERNERINRVGSLLLLLISLKTPCDTDYGAKINTSRQGEGIWNICGQMSKLEGMDTAERSTTGCSLSAFGCSPKFMHRTTFFAFI